jgi:chemotaxis methyl-accepting protein methylase
VSGLGALPGAEILRNTLAWRRLRHRVSLLVGERTNSHFTGFLRLPTQFEALAGPVVDHLSGRRGTAGPLRVGVLGCSNGAEAYTIASVLQSRHPHLAFRVHGFDIDRDVVAKARTARYTADEIYNNKIITAAFVESTFERADGHFTVKPHIAERVEFDTADVLSTDLDVRVGPSDIVFAQNFLFHLKRDAARKALENIARLLRAGGVLFLDGVDLDLRRAFVRRNGLRPLDYEIERIHEEARRARAVGWPYAYWGLEPFHTVRSDWQTRYATIFRAP